MQPVQEIMPKVWLLVQKFGIKAIIVMPESTSLLKVSATKTLGAEVMLKRDNFDEAYAFTTTYAKMALVLSILLKMNL